MRTRDLIAELQRFDADAQVAVSTNTETYFVSDVGRRERDHLGTHPVIYVVEKTPEHDESEPPVGYCPVGRCIQSAGHQGPHFDSNGEQWVDQL